MILLDLYKWYYKNTFISLSLRACLPKTPGFREIFTYSEMSNILNYELYHMIPLHLYKWYYKNTFISLTLRAWLPKTPRFREIFHLFRNE